LSETVLRVIFEFPSVEVFGVVLTSSSKIC